MHSRMPVTCNPWHPFKLLSKAQNAQVCDATKAEQSAAAG